MKGYHFSELSKLLLHLQRPSVYLITNVKHKETLPRVTRVVVSGHVFHTAAGTQQCWYGYPEEARLDSGPSVGTRVPVRLRIWGR